MNLTPMIMSGRDSEGKRERVCVCEERESKYDARRINYFLLGDSRSLFAL